MRSLVPRTIMANSKEVELKVDFFLNLCNLPPEIVPEKLRTNFGLACRLTADWCSIRIPVKYKAITKVCKFCLSRWTDTNCKVKILPTIKPGKAMRRIVNKVKRNAKLSEVERKLAMRAHSGNRLVINCLVCNKRTKIAAKKPTKCSQATETSAEPEISLPEKKKKKKKKTPILSFTLPTPTKVTATDDLFVLDTTGTPPPPTALTPKRARKKGGKATEGSLWGKNFIPLTASTPIGRKPLEKKTVVNPFAVRGKPQHVTENKRISSLKQLLSDDSVQTGRSPNPLRRFLNSL